jgi:hypothetical protein
MNTSHNLNKLNRTAAFSEVVIATDQTRSAHTITIIFGGVSTILINRANWRIV